MTRLANPAKAFQSWREGHEINSAVLDAASAEEALGLQARSVQDELDQIVETLEKSAPDSGAVWAADPRSYRSVADAHMQSLAFWFMGFATNAFPHLTGGLRLTLCGLLKSRKRTPFTPSTEQEVPPGLAFVALPVGFVTSIDLYFRAHFRLRDLGRRPTDAPKDSACVDSNALGGQDIEAAFAHSWHTASAVLLQLESGYLAAELFDPDLGESSDSPDWYQPELVRSTTQVFHELSGRGGPFVLQQASAESQAATYLCLVFALFHELAHQLVGHNGLAMAQALGINIQDKDAAIEAAVDGFALSAYTAFVDEKSRQLPEYGPIAALLHPARYSVGASAFPAVGIAIHQAEWIFYSSQSGQSEERQAKRDRDKTAAIESLLQRHAELAGKTWRYVSATMPKSGPDAWHLLCIGAFLEARCVAAGLHLMLDRFFGSRSKFCDYYFPIKKLLRP
ncbi:MAG TPA: hypothetical protein PKV98_10080 [Burkholderiaceae bacterium]|nr:hypothetical protein [Burkholderiaceae bacterium]